VKIINKYTFLLVILFIISAGVLFPQVQDQPQEIMTAYAYFDQISENYAAVEDYQADIEIDRESLDMKGILFYKTPDKIRINFSEPEEQVLALDGEILSVYIPKYRVIMEQKIEKDNQISGGASIASKEGLKLLKRNYSIAYLQSPEPINLDEDNPDSEKVVKLKLIWKSTDESFRQIDLSIGDNGLIRRMIGYDEEYNEIRFDFRNIIVNQNIPDARFKFDGPASANVYDNFLFDPEE
jgi:outer membrane lipoprotein-sorting protein